jgi:hypothetical protein
MLLFIQQNKIHQYPVAKRCSAVYQREPLRDTVPHEVQQCPYCMRFWPENEHVVASGRPRLHASH